MATSVRLKKASCKRASRMARPSEPSVAVLKNAEETVHQRQHFLTTERGLEKVRVDNEDMQQRFRLQSASTGKGPAVRAEGGGEGAQARMNHLVSIKSKNVDTNNLAPTWLMGTALCVPAKYAQLAAAAIKSNAVNSSVTQREKTQGAANQTSRINCKSISQAASAQCSAVAMSMAWARMLAISRDGLVMSNPMATNAANPCSLWKIDWQDIENIDNLFGVCISSQLVYNASPAKLGKGSVLTVAKQLASQELERSAISERMGSDNCMLEGICNAIMAPGQFALDPVWASWVLVVYLGCHPEGRALLRETPLTDVDYQTATAFENYGRAEITRRARLEQQQQLQLQQKNSRKKQKGENAPSPVLAPNPVETPAESNALVAQKTKIQANAQKECIEASILLHDFAHQARLEQQQQQQLQQKNSGKEQKGKDAPSPVLASSDTGIPKNTQNTKPALIETPFGDCIPPTPAESDALDAQEAKLRADSQKVLATKRKRGAKGCSSASTSDSAGLIHWWYESLRCDKASVLMTLVAYSKRAAKAAADATLRQQAGETGVASNVVIKSISEQNAERSAQRLAEEFVGYKEERMPKAMQWRWKGNNYYGHTRTIDDAHTTSIHACMLATPSVQPDCEIKLAWSVANMQFDPRTRENNGVPGVLERLQHGAIIENEGGKHAAIAADRIGAVVMGQVEIPLTTAISGVTRSTISMKTRIRMHPSQIEAGELLYKEFVALAAGTPSGSKNNGPPVLQADSSSLRDGEHEFPERIEPLCTPASRLAFGIGYNEELRTWLMFKSRKNDPCKVRLGYATSQELNKETPPIINSEPPPLLTIVDFNVEVLPVAEREKLPLNKDGTTTVDVGMALHVCGDAATRVPEMLRALRAELPVAQYVLQARATIFAASHQATYISNVGSTISAGHANSSICSSKKIAVADTHRLALLSAYDVYAAGLSGLEPNFIATPYAGTYGCCFETGISPPGNMAYNYRSDKRQHGNMALSEEMANELCPEYAASHWVEYGDGKHFCESPVQTRGVPHNLVPGIHASLNDMLEALETLRAHLGRQDAPTVDSLLCLPFSAFSQALAPVIEATADQSMRLCVRDPSYMSTHTGKAYLPDATSEEEAIVREPLLRRPSQTTIADNPFATSYEHIDTFFNNACAIALFARCIASVESDNHLQDLWCAIDAWIMNDTLSENLSNGYVVLAADAVLLLSCMYPSSWHISEFCIHTTWAEAVPALVKRVHKQLNDQNVDTCGPKSSDRLLGAPLCALVDEKACKAGRTWWAAFRRSACDQSLPICAWRDGVLPLLECIILNDGSHNVSDICASNMRDALNRAVQAAWLVHSPDGFAPPPSPCPAWRASSPSNVRRPVIDPVFVGNDQRNIEARACLIGLKPFQFRQVANLAMGADLKGVSCQVSRNEGGLCLRVSSAADIVDANGNQRSAKSISPVQTEADEAAFGTREDKLIGAAKQRDAWDKNVKLMTPIFTAIREPLPRERRRRRGENGDSWTKQKHIHTQKREQMQETQEALDAKVAMKAAAISPIALASERVLRYV
tara:strand:+ start:1007 stop:5650 length:4644 start_codon:yes stop_codon:yes gene_type:complete